jgi:hypothetical protein
MNKKLEKAKKEIKPLAQPGSAKQHMPTGQPRSLPRVRMRCRPGKAGATMAEWVYPHEVLRITKKAELIELLNEYSHACPTMTGSANHFKNHASTRYLIEWTYPTLRWYCRVYKIDTPPWLKGKAWAEGMSDKDHKKFLGKRPLCIREWREDPKFAGQRS